MTPKVFLIYGIVVCSVYTGLTFSKVAVIDTSPSQQISDNGSGGGSSGSGSGYSGRGYRWPDTGYHK